MKGTKIYELDAYELLRRGMASAANTRDGLISPETDAVNPLAVPGAIYAPASPTDKSGSITGTPLAWTPSAVAANGYTLNSDGKVTAIDSSFSLTHSSAITGTFNAATSDIQEFIDKIYASSATDVAKVSTDLATIDSTFWSVTLGFGVLRSGVRHPQCLYQDRLWIGDGNSLHYILNSSTGVKDKLVLASHHEITALGVDSGFMLIATSHGANASNTLAKSNSIFIYDGTLPTYQREYPVDGIVTGFRRHGGVLLVFYGGNKVGYWTGSGVKFLFFLKNVTNAFADMPYKHHSCTIDKMCYIIDGLQIMALGEIIPGHSIRYYAYKNNVNSNKLSCIFPGGGSLLGMGFSSAKLYTFDTMDVSTTNTMGLYGIRQDYENPVYVTGYVLEYADALSDNDNNRTLYVLTDDINTGFQIIQDYTSSVSAIKNTTGASATVIEVEHSGLANDKVRMLQARYNTDTNNKGLRRITVYGRAAT